VVPDRRRRAAGSEKYDEDSGRQQKPEGKRRPTFHRTMRFHGNGKSLPRSKTPSSTTGCVLAPVYELLHERYSVFTRAPLSPLLAGGDLLWHSYRATRGKNPAWRGDDWFS
jgi:hypothetical protein